MRDEKRIFDRLNKDMQRLQKDGFEVVGVFLRGSQNYNLDCDNSDIDTVAIVLPSIDDVILNKQPISTKYIGRMQWNRGRFYCQM